MTWLRILSVVHQSIESDIEQGSSDETIQEKWDLVVKQTIEQVRGEMSK